MAGKTWKSARAVPGAQFYNIALDNSTPVWAYGSIQDHGSYRGSDRSEPRPGCGSSRWSSKARPAAKVRTRPSTWSTQASSTRTGSTATSRAKSQQHSAAPPRARRTERRGRRHGPWRRGDAERSTNIAPEGCGPARAVDGADHRCRSTTPATIYAGYQYVFRSTNAATTWERISRDLTANDPTQMLLKSSNAIPYQTIVALAESPTKGGRTLCRNRRWPPARHAGRRQGRGPI